MPKITLRHSELADFRHCPLKHRLRWLDDWEAERSSDASRLGSAFHAVLAARYLAIQRQQTDLGYQNWREAAQLPEEMDPNSAFVEAATWQAFVDAADALDLNAEGRDTLEWMVEGYIEQYGVDPDWQVVLVESDLTVPFVEPSGKTSTRYDYQFHADLVVYDHGMKQTLLVDHKTTGQLLGQDDIDLSDQFGLYCWALTRLGYKHPIPVCNQVRTKKLQRAMAPSERYLRIHSFRTEIEMGNIAADALRTAKAIHSKANLDSPYSSPDPRQCGWKCEFVDTHLAIRKSARGLDIAPAMLAARGFTRKIDKEF